ncbi:hypothetical protein BDV59DRAFT_183481 [Aspergillus ambiguus]|uniref:uncharacterized protein n=1 Tax=Aspergillus ambiguus TaxID=176160 RepID=UPI003CCD04FD
MQLSSLSLGGFLLGTPHAQRDNSVDKQGGLILDAKRSLVKERPSRMKKSKIKPHVMLDIRLPAFFVKYCAL